MSRRKRIGIMGGTFDPLHMVHLTLAENAYHSFGLDEVMMLPNGDPPHKTDKIITPAVHRMAPVLPFQKIESVYDSDAYPEEVRHDYVALEHGSWWQSPESFCGRYRII